MGDMEDFKLANRAYRGVWHLENKANCINHASTDHHHHHKHIVCVRARALDHHHHHHHHLHPSNKIGSSTTASWNNNNKNKNYAYSYKKSPSWINDPEMKRQKRVVKYKAYGVEGKMKASLRNGFRWVKTKCCQLVHGY